MNAEQRKALDKIKKCLRLAGSNNPNEAANAMRQAQALMDKYNVDFDDVAASDVDVINKNATVKTTPTRWESALANLCANAFGCRILLMSSGGAFNCQWRFIGCGSAPELSGYAFDVLLRQIKKDRRGYIRTVLGRCKPANKTARADTFCLAWVWGVSEKVQAVAVGEKAEKAISAYMDKHHPNLNSLEPRVNKGRSNGSSDWKDTEAGAKAGQNAHLHRGVNGASAPTTALEHQE